MRSRPELVNLTFGGWALEVEGRYSPGRLGKAYLHNGDPGYPTEPPEFEIERVSVSAYDASGPGLDLPDLLEEVGALDFIADRALEKIEDAGPDEPPEREEDDHV